MQALVEPVVDPSDGVALSAHVTVQIGARIGAEFSLAMRITTRW
jgi:hypothetical protein